MLCINTQGYVWGNLVPDNRPIGLSIIAHEYFHVLQGQTGCLPGPDEHEYAWWVEGSATYVGWHTLVEAGLLTDTDVMDIMRQWGGFSDGLDRLAAYEPHISGDAQYALAYRAITELVVLAGTEAGLLGFCERVASGIDWRSAFEATYNISVEAFYTDFESRRQP